MTHIEQLRCLIYRKYGVNICCRYIKVHYLFRKLSCIILPTDAPTCLTSYNEQKRQSQCATGACFHGINCYEAFWYDLQRIKAAIMLVSPIMNY